MADNSVITLYRRKNICKVTSGDITSIPTITKMAFGDGGVDASGNPVQPIATATSLAHELGRYNIDGVTYPADTTARYAATIPANALAGSNINEVALVDSDNSICAIKTMFNKKKDNGVTFTFSFDDEF